MRTSSESDAVTSTETWGAFLSVAASVVAGVRVVPASEATVGLLRIVRIQITNYKFETWQHSQLV